MKPYFFGMTVCHPRTGAHIARKCGVVFAESQEEALELAWKKYGTDNDCEPWVEEIPESGYVHAVYNGMI